MTAFPGPPQLGRGVVTVPAGPLPAGCESWPRVVVDDGVIADPGPVAAELHLHWLRRQPVTVVLAADPGALRAPERLTGEAYEVEVGFEFERERLQYLVWSNNYDARNGPPVWWHARRGRAPRGDTG